MFFDEYQYKSAKSKWDYTCEETLELMLTELGLRPAHKGFKYLYHAILAVYQDSRLEKNMVTVLYESIAAKYETTAACVERAMRHTLLVAAETKADFRPCLKLFGTRTPPPPKKFIITFAGELRKRYPLE